MKYLDDLNIKVDEKLLNEALTHSSYSNEHGGKNYERLEYLGDAALELVISEYFYKNYSYEEGVMTKLRSSYVCEHALFEYAKVVGFIPLIRVGNGQIKNVNETIIADVFEAIIGAIFLSNNYSVCKKYILSVVEPFIKKGVVFYSDYKSALQELVQTDKKSLEYKVVKETGPSHDKTYEVVVIVDEHILGRGSGKSKKEAEAKAAFEALKKNPTLKENNYEA